MTRPSRQTHPQITDAQLNRAMLARQLLLARSDMGVVEAVEQLGGLQAQEAASPYLALWTRLQRFDADDLHRAFHARTVVKTSLMRVTLHAVSARDYRALLPAMLPLLRMGFRRGTGARPSSEQIAAWADAILAFTATPRSNTEIRAYIAEVADGLVPDDLWWVVRRHAPLIHVPEGVPWAFTRRPTLVAASAWLDDEAFEEAVAATRHVARRYLAAFGPATAADAAAWSGLSVRQLQPALDAVGERRFSDDRGQVLYDVERAPIPDAEVEAPPRLLPMWDSALLAYADRTRIVSDADRALVIARNGDVAPTFLVDGRVAGLWWPEKEAGGRHRIVLEPFRRLLVEDRRALEAEAERLVAFVEPHEPAVYARYRSSGARRR